MLSMKILVIAAIVVIPVGVVVHLSRESSRPSPVSAFRETTPRGWTVPTQGDMPARMTVEGEQLRRRERERFAPLLDQVRPLLETCKRNPIEPTRFAFEGRVLIWDLEADRPSDAQFYLPMNLRATSDDREMTVFVVVDQDRQLVRHYENGIPGYRVTLSVCVVSLPDCIPLGMVRVQGAPPPATLPFRQTGKFEPVYGDSEDLLAQWVKSCRHGRGR